MIDVAFTPAELRSADLAVVIDVLRATSTIGQALAAGYDAVLCADSVEQAAGMRGPGRVLAGERQCVKPPRFDQGNSPLEAATRRGHELVLATTNGAPAILMAARFAPTVLIASLLNLDAVSVALQAAQARSGPTIQLVCAGTDGAPALEDTYLAGRLCLRLDGERTDAARIAEAVARGYDTSRQALRGGAHATTLAASGLRQDVEHCSLESRLSILPRVVATTEHVAVVQSSGSELHNSVVPGRATLATVGDREPPTPFVHGSVRAAARAILDQGGWCVLEFCSDVPSQRWDAQLLIFDLQAEAVADVVSEEIAGAPERDARLTGCDRRTLAPRAEMGAHLFYLAEPTAAAPSSAGLV